MKQRQRLNKLIETKVEDYTERRGRNVNARWRRPKSMRFEVSKERPG